MTQKALPVKHKEVHWLNLPPIIMTCFYFISSFVTEKLRKRLFLHKNLDSLHDSIPASILPKEYGGVVPWKEMSDRWIATLDANREKLNQLDRMRWDDNNSNSGNNCRMNRAKPPEKQSNQIFQTIRESLLSGL